MYQDIQDWIQKSILRSLISMNGQDSEEDLADMVAMLNQHINENIGPDSLPFGIRTVRKTGDRLYSVRFFITKDGGKEVFETTVITPAHTQVKINVLETLIELQAQYMYLQTLVAPALTLPDNLTEEEKDLLIRDHIKQQVAPYREKCAEAIKSAQIISTDS